MDKDIIARLCLLTAGNKDHTCYFMTIAHNCRENMDLEITAHSATQQASVSIHSNRCFPPLVKNGKDVLLFPFILLLTLYALRGVL